MWWKFLLLIDSNSIQQLFYDVAPQTAENFRALCTGNVMALIHWVNLVSACFNLIFYWSCLYALFVSESDWIFRWSNWFSSSFPISAVLCSVLNSNQIVICYFLFFKYWVTPLFNCTFRRKRYWSSKWQAIALQRIFFPPHCKRLSGAGLLSSYLVIKNFLLLMNSAFAFMRSSLNEDVLEDVRLLVCYSSLCCRIQGWSSQLLFLWCSFKVVLIKLSVLQNSYKKVSCRVQPNFYIHICLFIQCTES